MGAYVYLPSSEAQRLQRLICLKYYKVLEWEIRFTLGLNTAENTDYIKNCSAFNFLQKSQWAHMSISPGMELGLQILIYLKYSRLPIIRNLIFRTGKSASVLSKLLDNPNRVCVIRTTHVDTQRFFSLCA